MYYNGMAEGAAAPVDNSIVLVQSLYQKIEAAENEFVRFIDEAKQRRNGIIEGVIVEIQDEYKE